MCTPKLITIFWATLALISHFFYDEIQCIHAEGRVKPQCCCAQVDAQNPCHATIKEKLSLQPFFCLKITSSHHQTYSAISQLEGFQLVSMLNFLFSWLYLFLSIIHLISCSSFLQFISFSKKQAPFLALCCIQVPVLEYAFLYRVQKNSVTKKGSWDCKKKLFIRISRYILDKWFYFAFMWSYIKSGLTESIVLMFCNEMNIGAISECKCLKLFFIFWLKLTFIFVSKSFILLISNQIFILEGFLPNYAIYCQKQISCRKENSVSLIL